MKRLGVVFVGCLVACGSQQGTEISQGGDSASPSALQPGLVLGTRAHVLPVMNEDQIKALNENDGQPSSSRTDATAKLNYFGGPVISNVRVWTVFWTPDVADQSDVNQFYTDVTNSPMFDWLTEYNTPTQTIGRGSFGGSIIDDAAPAGKTIDDTQIQNELARLIHAGKLQANDGNNLYMVHFPAGVKVTMQGQGSCSVFCAYHGTFMLDGVMTYYGVIPDQGGMCALGCGGGVLSSKMTRTTISASHELIEAVTDPGVGLAETDGPPLAWYDDNQGEIGDICNAQSVTLGNWKVQKEWSNSRSQCIGTAND